MGSIGGERRPESPPDVRERQGLGSQASLGLETSMGSSLWRYERMLRLCARRTSSNFGKFRMPTLVDGVEAIGESHAT